MFYITGARIGIDGLYIFAKQLVNHINSVINGHGLAGSDIYYTAGNVGFGGAPDSTAQLHVSGNAMVTGQLEVVGGVVLDIDTFTNSANITDSHYTVLIDASGGAVTATLPDATTNRGQVFVIKAIDISNAAVVDTAGGNIDGAASFTFTAQYVAITVQSNGANYFIL